MPDHGFEWRNPTVSNVMSSHPVEALLLPLFDQRNAGDRLVGRRESSSY